MNASALLLLVLYFENYIAAATHLFRIAPAVWQFALVADALSAGLPALQSNLHSHSRGRRRTNRSPRPAPPTCLVPVSPSTSDHLDAAPGLLYGADSRVARAAAAIAQPPAESPPFSRPSIPCNCPSAT